MNSFYSAGELHTMASAWETETGNTPFSKSESQTNCNNVWQFVLPVCFGGLIALLGIFLTGDMRWLLAFPLAVMLACHLVANCVNSERFARMVDLKGWTRWWRDSSAVRARRMPDGG